MVQIIWAESALDDVNAIAEYISLDNPTSARQLVKQIFQSVKRLKDFPESGRIPPELDDSSWSKNRYLEIIVGPCRILYRVHENKVYILYVMRSERALRNFIIKDRDVK